MYKILFDFGQGFCDTGASMLEDGVMEIPVNPSSLKLNMGVSTHSYDVLGVGQVSFPKLPTLRKVSFSSFFPREWAPYMGSELRFVEEYVNVIRKVQETRRVFNLIITRSTSGMSVYDRGIGDRLMSYAIAEEPVHDTSFWCFIDDFSLEDKGGEPGDVYYTISLTEFRDVTPMSVEEYEDAMNKTTQVPLFQRVDTPGELYAGQSVVCNGPYFNASSGGDYVGMAVMMPGIIARLLPKPWPDVVPQTEPDGWGEVAGELAKFFPVLIHAVGWFRPETIVPTAMIKEALPWNS